MLIGSFVCNSQAFNVSGQNYKKDDTQQTSNGTVNMNKGLYYYVTIGTDQENYHFLHRKGCKRMPDKEEVIFIGTLYNLSQALSIARINFKKVKPCIKCCIRYSAPMIHESVQPVLHFPQKMI